MQSKKHWEEVYSTKAIDGVSWFQEHAETSFRLINATKLSKSAAIIDVGGGASVLVDDLMDAGYTNLSVLDISASALHAAKQRLGTRASSVKWIESEVTNAALPENAYDIWHDRAVFHFLTTGEERQAYVEKVMRSVKPGGHVIIATFAEDGPEKCSGLPVVRYSPDGLHDEFGDAFELVHSENEQHHTPSDAVQNFIYCYCRKSHS